MLRVHTTSDRQSAVRLKPAASAEGKKMFLSVPEAFQPAGRRMTPSSSSPVVTKRQSPMSSLRARATIIVLRVLARHMVSFPTIAVSLRERWRSRAMAKVAKTLRSLGEHLQVGASVRNV